MSTHQPTAPLAPVDPQPVLGVHGEPCATCGAPLAADQRYCLGCGIRRADARLPFKEILAHPGERLAPASPGPAVAAAVPAANGGIAALCGLGVVLLALGTGVVVGQAGNSDAAPAPAPRVINLGGTAAAPATAVEPSAADAAKPSGVTKKDASDGSAAAPKAKNSDIQKLDKLTPQQYRKQSQKLPKVVGTGGAPPPKDDRPAAGGGDFEAIG